MFIQISKSIDDYIDHTNETTAALRAENGPLLRMLREFDAYFVKTLWRDAKELSPVAAFLSMNAYMVYLAGVRTALTGHVVAVFPLLRTALESACYAYLIAKQPELTEIWMNRERDEVTRKACRKNFTDAVAKVAKDLNGVQAGSGDAIMEAYTLAIDFGGHPNAKSILEHINLSEGHKDDAYLQVSLTGLYGAEHWETGRHLIACADFAMVLAVVLTRTLPNPDLLHQDSLQSLADLKSVSVKHFASET